MHHNDGVGNVVLSRFISLYIFLMGIGRAAAILNTDLHK